MIEVQEAKRGTRRKKLWQVLKLTLFIIVLIGVSWHGWRLWSAVGDRHTMTISLWWLLAAIPVSAVAWLPCATYWQTVLASFGFPLPWRQVIRAHCCGQLGKYAPGKALALVIRTGLLKGQAPPAAAMLAAFHEPLATMAIGGCLGIGLAAWLLPSQLLEKWGLTIPDSAALRYGISLAAAVGCALCLYILIRLAFQFRKRLSLVDKISPDLPSLPLTRWLLSLTGLLTFWWLQGLALGLTIAAVTGGKNFDLRDWPLWTMVTALSMVVGFLAVVAPGGLAIREAVIMELLASTIGSPQAVMAALLLRVAGLAGEILTAGVLYYGVSPPQPEPPA